MAHVIGLEFTIRCPYGTGRIYTPYPQKCGGFGSKDYGDKWPYWGYSQTYKIKAVR